MQHPRSRAVVIRFAFLALLAMGAALLVATLAHSAPAPAPAKPAAKERINQRQREAAARRAARDGMTSAVTTLAQAKAGVDSAAAAVTDKTPHFFGPFANYANSPLPTVQGGIVHVGNGVTARGFATDFTTAPGDFGRVFVTVPQAMPNGLLKAFNTFNQRDPAGSPTPSAGGIFHAYVLRPTGTADEYKVVFDSGTLTVPPLSDTAGPDGEVVSYPVNDIAVKSGDILGFYGQGVPVDFGGADTVSYPAPDLPPALDSTIAVGSADYPKTDTRTYSISADVVDLSGNNDVVVGGIKKFVDTLPGLGPDQHNNLGQYLPVAVPDSTTYPGSDYYEIGVVQYREKMHSDLPATLLRGYVQLSTNVIKGQETPLKNAKLDGTTVPVTEKNGDPILAVDTPHYLGPIISATKDRPVRIKFRNLLPKGVDGDLFLPVDTTVMGSGMGPKMGGMSETDPQNPMCGTTPKPAGCYTDNRATLHLHGGITPWISDGTPHQWITPAGETTDYPKGVSVSNVPDMPDPGDGSQTFFYTNQQSARMMFYHDHSYGITRLNVYAGEAAGYLISDDTEKKLVADGVIPGLADTLPLILQDKTFVPDRNQLDTTDPLWDNGRWGGKGNLWMPHVYMPAQNPGDSGGANAFGRWAYGPWFWPPNSNQIKHGPIANPYYDPACDSQVQWCEPPEIPGVPNNSMGMEAFQDTPLVNGTAYPETTVDPKAYRFKILNAANDRFWNLSLYRADATGTEVALNAAEVAAAKDDPFGVFPTPDTAKSPEGPSWLQIGTEGGFLPSPVEVKPQPITWVTDPTVFNAGNVDKHSLLIGPAERADVVVDFSAYAGKDLILYNDAPAAFPARDPRYDYYTDNADLQSTGGAPTTLKGYGPNTRTVMRIHVAGTAPAAAFDTQKVKDAFKHQIGTDGKPAGVFEKSQKPIVVGQGAYNDAYGTAFRNSAPRDGLARIHDFSLTFDTLSGKSLTIPFKNKAIQDEMGEAYEKDYGRMGGNLGLEMPGAQAGQQNLILYPYINPASEIIDGVTDAEPISTESDGTQIWKITHNGVDTHPIHFHLFDVQLINRVGWDGVIRKPDLNELGWKDTVRVSPLEDTIVALRPILPKAPFGVPDSVRPLNPAMPLGSTDGFNSIDANGNAITPALTNKLVNFGWEYVWHCHILSHEEMDMMRPISVNAARALPDKPVVTYTRNGGVKLTWTDGTPRTDDLSTSWGRPDGEIGYRIERAPVNANGSVGAYSQIATALANDTTYTDVSAGPTNRYSYRVTAFNVAGNAVSAAVLAGPAGVAVPAAPDQLAATLQAGPQVSLVWRDNATTETGFVVERSAAGGAFVPVLTAPARNNTGTVPAIADTTVKPGVAYQYRVKAVNGGGDSALSAVVTVSVPALPAAPSNLTATAVRANGSNDTVTLKWTDNAGNETGFTIQRSTDAGFANPTSFTAPANATQLVQTGMSRNRVYYYRVRATNLGGASGWSNAVSVTTP